MADRKGSVLVFGLLVVVFLAVISTGYFFSTINDAMMTQRHVMSMRAFWGAEAAVAQGIKSLPASTSGTLSDGVSFQSSTTHMGDNYYQVSAVGTCTSGGHTLSRTINAVVSTIILDPAKFQYAIETTVKLIVKGSVEISPAGSEKEYATINFNDLFSMSKEDVKAFATVYTAIPSAMSGVVWLEPPAAASPSFEWDLTSNLVGSGILVVEGDIHIAGTVNWDGIIYVMGKLRMSGTPIVNGTVLAESGITVDDTTMTGNVSLNYSLDKITAALNLLSYASAKVVSWKELQ